MRHVVWLTGLSGSGKTTLGRYLVDHLHSRNVNSCLIDGDLTRDFFGDTNDYSRINRVNNIQRIAFAAYVLAQNDVLTIVSNIAPYVEARDFIRSRLPKYCQIYLKSSLAVCEKRDVKGLYAKARSNEVEHFIGIHDPYEEPRNPDLIIPTDEMTIDESLSHILNFLEARSVL